ncbi:hypothetical protein PG637_06425 [Riemerella anatipestifer]|nr:hypothetical protein [Riemerella anatipestifer]MDY3325308.1 hypothetical protein [Riemerella anatipestifer]MDY3352702.1 hypothetical protein [Riemerella anatipestifer]
MMINKDRISYISFLLSTLILLSTILIENDSISYILNAKVGDGDNYVGLFRRYLELGHWNAVSEGTSVLYNIAINVIYTFTKNEAYSIFILNFISILVSLLISCYLIYKIINHKIYSSILVLLLISLFIKNKLHIPGNDDLFSGMLYSFIVYLLYKYQLKEKNIYIGGIGVLLGLCFSIRELTILWLPIILIFVAYFGTSIREFFKLFFTISIPMMLTVFIMHFPAIQEKGRLSFYDKQPENRNINWMQRNYLGLKKIEKGELPLNPGAIWKGTSFMEVEQYLLDNGNDSLPRTYLQAFQKDPVLFAKITLYNLNTTIKYYFSGLGFLVIFPILLSPYSLRSRKNIYYLVFGLFSIMICTIAYSFVEFRWFHGTESFLFLSIAFATHNAIKNNRIKLLQIIYLLSLVFILINYLRSYIL